MKHFLAPLFVAAVLSPGTFAQYQSKTAAADSAEKTLTQMENDWAQALVKGDAAAVDRIQSPDYVFIDTDGQLMTKAQGLADLKSGTLKFQSLSIEGVKVRVYGDTAIVTSINVTKGSYKGNDISGRSRWTDVFVKRGASWVAVSSHGSNIKEKSM